MPLEPLPAKVWWLILPACIALYSYFALHHLPHHLLRYAY